MKLHKCKEITVVAKRKIFLSGVLQTPIRIGERAWINTDGQTILTSVVTQIMEVSAYRVVFETCNSIYSVSTLVPTKSGVMYA